MQIALGSRDDPGRVRIDDHVWVKDRIPWFDVADKLPRFATNSSAVATKTGHDRFDPRIPPTPFV